MIEFKSKRYSYKLNRSKTNREKYLYSMRMSVMNELIFTTRKNI